MKNAKRFFRLLVCLIVLLPVAPGLAAAAEGDRDYSRADLAQMLAPVALYPDTLLSQVLMAATYPLELIAADRWLQKNALLKGDNLDEALRDRDWDASVKALCHVPALLRLMSERLEETIRLGDAFLTQEREVMDTIQDLRSRAIREGNLKSTDKQKVTVLDDGTIIIEPGDPQIVYVPYYDTRYVYGTWWYPAWQPWYWGPGEVVAGPGIYFWPDVYVGFSFGFGFWSHFDWPRRTIFIDAQRRPHFYRHDYDWGSHHGPWHYEPRHRKGSGYRDHSKTERSGQSSERVRRSERRSTSDPVIRGPVTGRGGGTVGTGGSNKSGEDRRSTLPPVEVGEKAGRRGRTGGLVKLP